MKQLVNKQKKERNDQFYMILGTHISYSKQKKCFVKKQQNKQN